jgi:TetR/AcrR family transcriptional regulator, fatty acid metabolism regulator protein
MNEADKRQRIMQAAEKLFASRRFHEITTDDVAHEAKVGKGTIYRYFRDKDDLFFETANSGFDELCDLLRDHVSKKDGFAQQLLQACVQISQFFQRRRELFEMMQTEDGRMSFCAAPLRDRWLEKRKRLVDVLSSILSGGVREGVIRPDVPADVLANFLLGMLRTRARDLRDYPESVRLLPRRGGAGRRVGGARPGGGGRRGGSSGVSPADGSAGRNGFLRISHVE